MQSEGDRSVEAAFEAALEHARHILPAQGPIGNFVHHNTLHAYQHLPFHRAIAEACALHDAEGYLSEAQYRVALASGRIAEAGLTYALELRQREVADEPLGTRTRLELEQLLLRYGLSAAPSAAQTQLPEGLRDDLPEESRELLCSSALSFLELAAGRAESELDRLLAPITSLAQLSRLAHRDLPRAAAQLLFAVCDKLAPPDALPHQALLARFRRDRTARDLLAAVAARDPNELTNPILVELLGAYLDVGMARWSMPHRERGLIACFLALMRSAPDSLPPFQRRALARLERIQSQRLTVREFSVELLAELGVAPEHFEAYVSRSLLELPGWSGMVARLEQNPSDRELDAPPASLAELTAIRLALDIEAYAACAREVGYEGSIAELDSFVSRRRYDEPLGNHENVRLLFEICQLSAISAEELFKLGQPFAQRVCALGREFDESVRRRLLHEAYEHAHLREVLDAVARNREESAQESCEAPRFQVMFCIDDREESIRRYFEELAPGHLTYGVAGFFGVAMRFRGIDDANAAALCPIVVQPGHAIEEVPVAEHAETLVARRRRQNMVARFRFELGDSSRSLARGAALTPLLGLFSAVPLTLRVLFPHAAEQVTRWLHARTLPQPRTELRLLRDDAAMRGSLASGFTIDEQAERVAGTLENVGVVKEFAQLVTMLGHGASTVNNPHHSAYDCGACGGRNGGPNARAFAAMANSPLVRAKLRERGIDIPDSTWFLGGLHDTTTDEVRLADLELMPERFQPAFAELRAALDKARALSALERCRKFEHAPRTLTPEAALRHVEERAVDLSQARPELGHASNAVCVVGRRELSRGLFLDRRAFLVSYSADIDPDLNILERVLGAVVPVGAGINLEYYFSTVDNDVWGSGTKLPHNLSGLLGVMEGSSGDLRTGLPRQMIEVHDPVRLLSIVEAAPEAILEVASRKPEVAELVTNEWVRLASVHPDTGAIQVFDGGRFRPYAPSLAALRSVAAAHDWYHGQLGFLAPVRIAKGKNRAA